MLDFPVYLIGLLFILSSAFVFGQDTTETVTDIEGNVYHTIKIGTQTWMKENLKVTRYTNGASLQNIKDVVQWSQYVYGAYCWYNNDIFFKDTYGALYNYWAINDQTLGKQLAPKGWHIPSNDEWQILIDYLGGEKVAGGKMKEPGTDHWVPANEGASNESGFTALPSGYLYNGHGGIVGAQFWAVGILCSYWSTTKKSEFKPYSLKISSDNAVNLTTYNRSTGLSIRCIKD